MSEDRIGAKLPPRDQDAEEAVIGSLIIDGESIHKIVDFLKASDFFYEQNQWLYGACLALYNRTEAINQITVAQELNRQNKLEPCGGAAHLSHLISICPTSLDIEHYGQIVRRLSLMRGLINAGDTIARIGYEASPDVDGSLSKAENTLMTLRQGQGERSFTHIREVLDKYFEANPSAEEQPADGVYGLGVPSGFTCLDEFLGGFQSSDLIIVAGRPSMGKTSLALNIARNAAIDHKICVALLSLEMSCESLVIRLLSNEAGINLRQVRFGLHTDEEERRIMEAIGVLAEGPIYIDDSPRVSITEVRSKVRRLNFEHPVGLVVVDYLQLMDSIDSRMGNRVQEVSYISRALKALARELNVPVIAVSQLSRAVEGRPSHEPQLSDLRESGCVAGDTLVYRPDIGVYERIDALLGQQVNALGVTDKWKQARCLGSNVFATGRKPVFRLTTARGYTIRATANHQFPTVGGWTRLDQLRPDDHIATPRSLPEPTAACRVMSDEEITLLAHMIGNGCMLKTHALQYTTPDLDIANLVADAGRKMFGIDPEVNPERNWYQVYLHSSQPLARGTRNPVAVWLETMGLWDHRAGEKFVPAIVWQQLTPKIALFLRHIWATDGHVSVQGGYPSVYYCSSSERLARDVQGLLLRLGITAGIDRVKQRDKDGRIKGADQHVVTISGHEDLVKFCAAIGVVAVRKQPILSEVKRVIAGVNGNTNRDIIPKTVWRGIVEPARYAAGVSQRKMQADMGMSYCGSTLYKSNLSRERAQRVAAIVRSEELTALANSDVYWDKITSIVPDGEAEVYDLTADGLHNFLANGIFVHNSIEQDSDVVLFIYREEYYYKEEEWALEHPDREYPRGEADILIAKHRNGPTGRVKLHFKNTLASFENLPREEVSTPDEFR